MQTTDIAGHAVYIEFQRESSTVQVLITPEGLTETFNHVPPTMYRRQIHTTAARATWRVTTFNRATTFNTATGVLEVSDAFEGMPTAEIPAVHGIKAFDDSRLFRQLAVQGYKLRRQPIVVEVSVADMNDIRAAKTPYKVLNRVTKTRKALKFPDTLFASEE
jgi:hypothetical protein